MTAKKLLYIIQEQKAEIEMLKEFIVETRRCDKEIKFEAVKEFADRLKERQVRICDCFEGVSIIDIDNLVKEYER